MSIVKEYFALALCFMMCKSQCFIEEQSTTPMKALRILNNVESWRYCVAACRGNAACVTASYSDAKRICHLQTHSDIEFPACGATPYRRFRKTQENCIAGEWVTYDRKNLTREHGIDPCYPDPSLLHPELINLDGIGPACPIRKLDGSEGPILYHRGIDGNGPYISFGTNVRMNFSKAVNHWVVYYDTDVGTYTLRYISGACAEIGDACPCPPLKAHPSGGTAPNLNGKACPVGKQLRAQRDLFSMDLTVTDGTQAMVFCAGGKWMGGEIDPGNFVVLNSASCF